MAVNFNRREVNVIIEGKAHVFGDHINTDYIISAKVKNRLTDFG
jgi:3-isopropylmalate dehydratase small subunit